MMSIYGCRTKKDQKAKVGQDASSLFLETSIFGPEYKGPGSYPVVGPAPTERKWYATVVVGADGKVVKVLR